MPRTRGELKAGKDRSKASDMGPDRQPVREVKPVHSIKKLPDATFIRKFFL
jgi:hypothetical protein